LCLEAAEAGFQSVGLIKVRDHHRGHGVINAI
jgi:hypothetical protein